MAIAWILFIAFVVGILILDLGIFHKRDKIEDYKTSFIWSAIWISFSLIFNGIVYWWMGEKIALDYFTGYIVEKSLSMDNLFVFLMIFKAFNIPPRYQHRILFWGIIGALVLRVAMISLGISLIHHFHFTIYLFGAFLLFTGFKILSQGERKFEFRKSLLAQLVQKFIPVTTRIEGNQFFINENGRWKGTPLFMALITVEISDIIFAVDSVPAVLAITTDTFIVFTSNIFAILGLRSLYFLLASMVSNMRFLDTGLSYILIFVGVKMLLSTIYKIPTFLSLGIILGILSISVGASILWPKKKEF